MPPDLPVVGTTAHTYDDAGRETAILTTGPTGGTIASYGYTHDLADRLLTKTEDGVVTNFAYDKSGQLVQDGAQTFAYDETGNRTNGTDVGANNRLESDGVWTYTYDAEGNRVGKSKAGESWTYSYDHRGQMTSALKGDGSGSQYFYDAFGNRIRSVSLGAGGTVLGEERYAVDGWDTAKPGAVGTENFDVWADLNASNAVTMRRMTGGVSVFSVGSLRGQRGPAGVPLALLASEQRPQVTHRIRARLRPTHAAALEPLIHHLLARGLHRAADPLGPCMPTPVRSAAT